jgi:hypothetical protein
MRAYTTDLKKSYTDLKILLQEFKTHECPAYSRVYRHGIFNGIATNRQTVIYGLRAVLIYAAANTAAWIAAFAAMT